MSRMIRAFLAFGLALLLLPACQQPPAPVAQGGGVLTIRAECEEGTPGAVRETFLGRSRWYGLPQSFDLEFAYPLYDEDDDGFAAIGFDVVEPQKAAYDAFTSQEPLASNNYQSGIYYRSIAYYVDGKFVSAYAPSVDLFGLKTSGRGVILPGPEGFSPSDLERLLARLRGS